MHTRHLSPKKNQKALSLQTAVVIPVYNDAAYLRRCLERLAEQTHMPDQVIVVDNNCTDNSAAIASNYPFVTVVQETTQGICAAAKTGYDTAANLADIILRCDADSRPSQDWVESIVETFHRYPHIAAVTGPGVLNGLPTPLQPFAQFFYMQLYFWSVGAALGQKPLFGSNCDFRAEMWQKTKNTTHLHRQDLHDDIDLSYHIAQYGKIFYNPHLKMPISARPFRSLRGLLKRFPMGLRSIFVHWPEQAPWQRPQESNNDNRRP
ncbi:glycosyltransferase family 2 protein [Candidatus Saccharibacteria bacterium]|nr:glycosyltransferase family 2 protein [Candidatus Saccharibacteria bacterium]